MALYLVQHGRSSPKEIDPQQGITEEDRKEVERIAMVAAGYGVKANSIIHSGKKRANQAAKMLADILKPTRGLTQKSGPDSLDDIELFARTIDSDADVMVFGHLPFLEKLASYLIMGKTDHPVFKMQNGGILCLDRLDEAWTIKWALMPHIG
jgi:phosphohistidine phosphatase